MKITELFDLKLIDHTHTHKTKPSSFIIGLFDFKIQESKNNEIKNKVT